MLEDLLGGGMGAEGSAGKADKDTVTYIQATGNEACASCRNFVVPDECSSVEGVINPGATCDLFAPAAQVAQEQENLMSDLLGGGINV